MLPSGAHRGRAGRPAARAAPAVLLRLAWGPFARTAGRPYRPFSASVRLRGQPSIAAAAGHGVLRQNL